MEFFDYDWRNAKVESYENVLSSNLSKGIN